MPTHTQLTCELPSALCVTRCPSAPFRINSLTPSCSTNPVYVCTRTVACGLVREHQSLGKGMFERPVARPKRVLAAWAVVVGLLALLGAGVEQRLHRQDLIVPGTRSA